MNKYVESSPKEVTAIQWYQPGDHPKVKTNSLGVNTILTKDGPKKVRPGEYIVRYASNDFRIFQESEFKKKFTVI